MVRLRDKVAIVTGGASGIGEAIVLRFAREGAKVVIADRNEPAGIALARRVAAEIPEGSATFIGVDMTDHASVEHLVQETMRRLGRLDILVNNAGVDGEQALIADSSVDNWRAVLAVNLDGVYFGLKHGLGAMMASGSGGAVVNIASIAGLVGYPALPAYNASKGGVVQLTRAAAVEYADKRIRVNALCPSAVLTPMIEHFFKESPDPDGMRMAMELMNPLPGIPTTDDVAAAALFLASDEARFITGVALPIDGGFTAR